MAGKPRLSLLALVSLTVKKKRPDRRPRQACGRKREPLTPHWTGQRATAFPRGKPPAFTASPVQGQLDAPNKRFQEYNEALRAWQEKSQTIEGAADMSDTLKGLRRSSPICRTNCPVISKSSAPTDTRFPAESTDALPRYVTFTKARSRGCRT